MAAYNRPLQRPTASSTENTGKIVNLKKIQIDRLVHFGRCLQACNLEKLDILQSRNFLLFVI